jgi:O-Antigen ligase.
MTSLLRPSGALILKLVALMAVLAAAGGVEFGGLRVSAIAWIVPLAVSCMFVAVLRRRVRFPWAIWVPWLVYLVFATDFSRIEALVRFFILVTPLMVAMATSTAWRASPDLVPATLRWVFLASLALYGTAVVMSGNLAIGDGYWYLVEGTCMTFVLLGVAAAIRREHTQQSRYLVLAVCFVILLVSESRSALLVLAALLIIAPTGSSWRLRLGLLGFYAAGFVVLFQTAAFQEVMFRSAVGSVTELAAVDSAAIRTGGRLVAWPAFIMGMNDVWFGQGSVASSDYGQMVFGQGRWSHPHNEYIRLLFDYGVVGTFLFIAPLVWLVVDLLQRLSRETDRRAGWLLRFSVSCLIGFALLAVSGNVLMYHAWYGNIVFASIGLCYALPLRPFARSKPA